MLDNGDDPSKVTDETFERGDQTRPEAAVDAGQIRQFTGNDYAQPLLARATLAAAVAWSGDIVQLLASNPKLKWAIPRRAG